MAVMITAITAPTSAKARISHPHHGKELDVFVVDGVLVVVVEGVDVVVVGDVVVGGGVVVVGAVVVVGGDVVVVVGSDVVVVGCAELAVAAPSAAASGADRVRTSARITDRRVIRSPSLARW
jgi:uncharacterized Zn-binding protein involved in type VI secretion